MDKRTFIKTGICGTACTFIRPGSLLAEPTDKPWKWSKEALYQGTYFLPVAAGNYFTKFIAGNLYQSWSDKLSLLQREMANRGIDMPEVSESFTKNDYFAMAEQKLNLGHWEMTQMLWDTYNPNKLWYVIVCIGVFTIIALSVYDRMVIRPREAKSL